MWTKPTLAETLFSETLKLLKYHRRVSTKLIHVKTHTYVRQHEAEIFIYLSQLVTSHMTLYKHQTVVVSISKRYALYGGWTTAMSSLLRHNLCPLATTSADHLLCVSKLEPGGSWAHTLWFSPYPPDTLTKSKCRVCPLTQLTHRGYCEHPVSNMYCHALRCAGGAVIFIFLLTSNSGLAPTRVGRQIYGPTGIVRW